MSTSHPSAWCSGHSPLPALTLLLALLVLLSGCATAPPETPDEPSAAPSVAISTVRERHALDDAVHTLRIVNRYGEINLRGMPEMAVGVHATVQRFGENGPLPRLQFEQVDGQASLEVVYDDARPRHRGRPGRIDLAVYVPELKQLDLVGGDDRVQLRRYGGNVRASTRDGQMQIGARGWLDLSSAGGEIRAMLLSPPTEGSVRIEGERLVEVLFPPEATLRVDVQARSLIDDAIGLVDSNPDPLRLERAAASGLLWIRGDEVYLRPLHLLEE